MHSVGRLPRGTMGLESLAHVLATDSSTASNIADFSRKKVEFEYVS